MELAVTLSEKQTARHVDLEVVLRNRGYDLKREGSQWRVVGHAGLIVTGNRWYSHSTGVGGNALDFLVEYLRVPFPQAMEELLGGQVGLEPVGATTPARSNVPERKPLVLPERDTSNLAVLMYLSTVRRLPYRLVTGLITGDLLYQDQRKNAVFVCRDRAGQVKGAALRGTDPGVAFKGMAQGSDSRYGWLWVPDREPSCKGVVVTEAPIDAVSVEALYGSFGCSHLLSLNGLRKSALSTFLEEHPAPARGGGQNHSGVDKRKSEEIETELSQGGSKVIVVSPKPHKDWSELLVSLRLKVISWPNHCLFQPRSSWSPRSGRDCSQGLLTRLGREEASHG